MAAKNHAKMAAAMKQRLKVEELAENYDELEDVVEDVFPVLVLTMVLMCVLMVIFALRLYLRWFTPNPSQNRIDGKTVLITGATSGIGKSTAVELARRGGRIVITGKDRSKVEAVARNIRKKTGNQQVNGMPLDLASLRNIRDFVEEFQKREKFLHVLINDAGYLGPERKTDDGLERSFGVNYLGHFYLTYLLVDIMKKNAPSRIINVTSDAYKSGKLDLADLALAKYNPSTAYARSKLAQLLFNNECHRRYFQRCVWSFAVHPGPTATELLRSYPGTYGSFLRLFARVMFKPPEDGMQTVVYCAVGDGLREFSGKYFQNCQVVKTQNVVRANAQLSARLWNTSAELCGFEGDAVWEEEVQEVIKEEEAAKEVKEEDKKAQ